MIDTAAERLITFCEASGRLPSKPHACTIHRWSRRGVRGVRLETVLVGGRRFTSVEALRRFMQRATAAAQKTDITK